MQLTAKGVVPGLTHPSSLHPSMHAATPSLRLSSRCCHTPHHAAAMARPGRHGSMQQSIEPAAVGQAPMLAPAAAEQGPRGDQRPTPQDAPPAAPPTAYRVITSPAAFSAPPTAVIPTTEPQPHPWQHHPAGSSMMGRGPALAALPPGALAASAVGTAHQVLRVCSHPAAQRAFRRHLAASSAAAARRAAAQVQAAAAAAAVLDASVQLVAHGVAEAWRGDARVIKQQRRQRHGYCSSSSSSTTAPAAGHDDSSPSAASTLGTKLHASASKAGRARQQLAHDLGPAAVHTGTGLVGADAAVSVVEGAGPSTTGAAVGQLGASNTAAASEAIGVPGTLKMFRQLGPRGIRKVLGCLGIAGTLKLAVKLAGDCAATGGGGLRWLVLAGGRAVAGTFRLLLLWPALKAATAAQQVVAWASGGPEQRDNKSRQQAGPAASSGSSDGNQH